MPNFTNEEYGQMVYILGEARGVATEAARIYRERYPNRRHPISTTFTDTYRRVLETGNVLPRQEKGGHNLRDRRVTEKVLNLVEADPTTSTRRIAREVKISHMTVHRILKAANLYPYHHTPVQDLLEGDFAQRVNFCRWLLTQSEVNPGFHRRILFTDESLFTRAGTFNFHNSHTYAEENPHFVRVVNYQHRWKLNVWAGLIGTHVIGPFVLPEKMNGELYARLLTEDLPELLEDVPLDLWTKMWFQQDGAPPHNIRPVSAILENYFPNRWIAYRGPVRWPPRSPDLTPLDFFFWGHLKNEVYVTEPGSLEVALERLKVAVANIDERTLDNVWTELLRRARACIEAGGRHFEQLLK
ncbi:histone-lysine N-methyltransferase SETMAR-like [Prorops nasuta]|uniref:histone-lysine N-methyltransferase SETMAR-like n=1 Tax=Prorops nasuta TaxID=863751 RepID=UPI0034CFB7D3